MPELWLPVEEVSPPVYIMCFMSGVNDFEKLKLVGYAEEFWIWILELQYLVFESIFLTGT